MNSKMKKVFIARMVKTFHRFNSDFFGGLITVPQFGIVRGRHQSDGITYFPNVKLCVGFWIDPNSREFEEVILHEMCHLNQYRLGCEHSHDGCFPAYSEIFRNFGYDIES